MARSSLEVLEVTGRGVGVLDRARDRSGSGINPFWAAVGTAVAVAVLLGVMMALRIL